MLLVLVFSICYIVPAIILDLLQFSHIKKALRQKAVLLEPAEYIQAGNYALEKLKLNIFNHIIELCVFALWALWGLSALWDFIHGPDFGIFGVDLSANVGSGFGQRDAEIYRIYNVIFLVSTLVVSSIISLPASIYQTFVIDKKYGFCKQSAGLFFLDLIKSLVLIILIAGAFFYALLAIMDSFRFWWVWAFALAFCGILLANAIYPTIIAPLFNKFTPLTDENLKGKIEEIMQKVGFKSSGIFVMDASRRDGRLNAYFGGLGKTKRVVLFDTLLDKISTSGLLAILGHELGHFKNKDILKRMALSGAFLLGIFFVAQDMPTLLFDSANLPKNSASTLLLIIFLSPIISFLLLPIVGYFSRKAEYRADEFGAQLGGKSELANALVRLVNENKSFPSSHPLYIFFYYSHPPLLERLKALDYKA